MMSVAFRPKMPPATILEEIVCDDAARRFRACEAVCATIWGAGLNSCATLAERRSWQLSYAEHLARLAVTYAHETTPRS